MRKQINYSDTLGHAILIAAMRKTYTTWESQWKAISLAETVTVAADSALVIANNSSVIQCYALRFKSSLYKLIYFRAEFSHEKSCIMPFRISRFHSSGC
jgi:hypothetical protein